MLKLIFSPYYDGNCYAGNPAEGQCKLGTKYVGPLGLLDELELRSGLSRRETSPMQRAIAYCNAIHKVLSKPKGTPFYLDSFKNDPLGVAQQLLRWRDALCMAGWNKDKELPNNLSSDGKKRIEDLQAIEEHFKSIGIGERWHQLLNAEFPEDLSIVVDMKMELLPPVIRKVLDKTKRATESEAVKNLSDKTLSVFAGKFTLYQFPEQNDAYQWAATQTEMKPDVFINEDNFTFNQVLKSVGKPLVSASIQGSVPEMSQLLKLGVALFRQPVNLTHLINYLTTFRHPIQWQTRSYLRNKIQDDGGFKSVTDGKGNLIPFTDPSINDTVSDPNLWGMWEKTHLPNGNVQTADVTAFCDALLKWLKKAKQVAAIELDNNPDFGVQLSSQLAVLENQTQYLKAYLSGITDISNDELDKVVASICQADSIQTDYGRLGSYDMLKDLKGLAVSGKTVIWMDCVRKPRPRYEYAFMNPTDIKELQKAGLMIPDATLEMQASDFAEKLAVSRAEKILALVPQRKDGERTEENLIITELLALDKTINIGEPGLPIGLTITPSSADTQKVERQVDKALFANIDQQKPSPANETTPSDSPSEFTPKPVGYQRNYESFSSLSELINQPFDYVMDYIYNMKDEDSSNLSTVEGNVAHWVISQMVEDCRDSSDNVDTQKFLNLCKSSTDLETRANKAIFDVGAQLLQPENEMECLNFKRIFTQKSVPVLVKIIEDNNLEVVDSEVEYTSELNDFAGAKAFNFYAKIDFLLKRKSEESKEYEYLIFDFKWTGSPSKREKELEDCKELQLALYQKIAERKGKNPIVMRGYYLLKQAQLLTVNDVLKPNDNIVIVKQTKLYDIFEQSVASYRERIQNLKDGYIEEGEEMKGTEFIGTQFIDKYYPDPTKYYLHNNLCATAKKDGMTAKTKSSTYGKNSVLKGKIK